MNIYKLENFTVTGYDTYDSCIVAANSEDDARQIHPAFNGAYYGNSYNAWCKPSDVVINLIGVTDLYDQPTVILSSFNAG